MLIHNVRPMVFLTDLATNATAKNVSVILFSGNDDALVSHLGTESKSFLHRRLL